MGVENLEVFEDLDSVARGLAASLRAKTGWDGEIDCVLSTYVSADERGTAGRASVKVRAWVPTDIADKFDHRHTEDCWDMGYEGYKCQWLREATDE